MYYFNFHSVTPWPKTVTRVRAVAGAAATHTSYRTTGDDEFDGRRRKPKQPLGRKETMTNLERPIIWKPNARR